MSGSIAVGTPPVQANALVFEDYVVRGMTPAADGNVVEWSLGRRATA